MRKITETWKDSDYSVSFSKLVEIEKRARKDQISKLVRN